jgi:hypothetical protein
VLVIIYMVPSILNVLVCNDLPGVENVDCVGDNLTCVEYVECVYLVVSM